MAVTTHQLVIAAFNSEGEAQKAVSALKSAGFREDQIGAIARGAGESTNFRTESAGGVNAKADGDSAGAGAAVGALTGVGVGALVGLGVLSGVIPVVGPAIAAGTLGVLFSNAAAGAAVAGLTGALVGWGMSDEEAEYYQGEVKSGKTVITVHADDRKDECVSILRQHGGYDMKAKTVNSPSTRQDRY